MQQLPPRPKFYSISLNNQPFLGYRPFWEKCTKWAQKDNHIEH